MAESTEQEYFTSKHAKLDNLASATNIFAWIVLFSQILYVAARFIQFQNSYELQGMFSGTGQPSFLEMLSHNTAYTLSVIVDLANILIKGVVYWLVLRGVSFGLNMIVETDLNYRDEEEVFTDA